MKGSDNAIRSSGFYAETLADACPNSKHKTGMHFADQCTNRYAKRRNDRAHCVASENANRIINHPTVHVSENRLHFRKTLFGAGGPSLSRCVLMQGDSSIRGVTSYAPLSGPIE
jgi:hypothetical protein